MKRHNWKCADLGIEVCANCGMYRCCAMKENTGRGPKEAMNVEYSLPDGEVIALNPDKVPPCEP
jgi:hypothetical protein